METKALLLKRFKALCYEAEFKKLMANNNYIDDSEYNAAQNILAGFRKALIVMPDITWAEIEACMNVYLTME